MRIVVVRVGRVLSYPPTISLINALVDLGHEVYLVTTLDSEGCEKSVNDKCKVHYVNFSYAKKNKNMLSKFINLFNLKKKLWKIIESLMLSDSILWVEDDITIKHLGYKLINYKYALRFDELNERLYYTRKLKFLHMNEKKICENAIRIVVPEYNRAHIMKAWWNLSTLPTVLPNKLYFSTDRNFDMDLSYLSDTFEKIGQRKIIIYQGGYSPERPVDKFVKAISHMDDYVCVLMGIDFDKMDLSSYKNCFVINRIDPPFHLNVTKKAHIGIICYTPVKDQNSPLNTLYCAPNKIYEYGRFGIPMIGNDLPGLKSLFDKYSCGVTSELNYLSIMDAIKEIDSNYNKFSNGAKRAYDDVDVKKIVENIIPN